MAARARILPAAQIDLEDVVRYISIDDADAAARFRFAFDSTARQLLESPHLGNRDEFDTDRLAGILHWRVQDFERYLIFYRSVPTGIDIVRVLHSSRDIPSQFE
jgi:toxin ParE1/3/4